MAASSTQFQQEKLPFGLVTANRPVSQLGREKFLNSAIPRARSVWQQTACAKRGNNKPYLMLSTPWRSFLKKGENSDAQKNLPIVHVRDGYPERMFYFGRG
jgi:hypothetical protein